ncbi:MAG: MFS transporter [Candidatus Hodarchaeota archaeon]
MGETEVEIVHSKKSMVSYGFGKFMTEFMNIAFGAYAFYYYEDELGLNVWLAGTGFILWAIWNMVNDPLIGFLTNRPFKFTRKWGRRFPWIIVGGIPWVCSYLLIFTPPTTDPIGGAWILFIWLIFTTCLYDTFGSLFFINFVSLFPDKFRTENERRKVAGISTPVGIFGIALGSILPPLFVEFGELNTYIIQGGVVLIICLIALGLAIPGTRDDEICVERYLAKCEAGEQQEAFFRTLKKAVKQKNFQAFITTYTLYTFLTISMTASIPYVVKHVLKMEADAIILVMAGFLVGALVSTPLWVYSAHKIDNNRRILIIAGFTLGILTAPMLILEEYMLIIIFMTIWGVGLGGFWSMYPPTFAELIDEAVVNFGKREEGIYNGILQFFGRLSFALQALTFAVVHTLTGFEPGASEQKRLAIFGIHIHLSLIPMLAMIIGTFMLVWYYDLKPDKVKTLREKLIELNL